MLILRKQYIYGWFDDPYSLIYLLFSLPYNAEVVVPNRYQFLGATAGVPTPFTIIIGYSMSPKSGCG